MRILSATCQRNEGPFILEWIAYHRLIGVTDFLIVSNDCDDGSDGLLDALARAGAVTHEVQTVADGDSVQWEGLRRIWKHPLRKSCDWMLFSDIDEFPMIHAEGHRLGDALAALPEDASALALPWRLFGGNGVGAFHDRPVTAQFTRSAPEQLYHPIAGRHFKSLFRPDHFQRPGVHRPRRGKLAPLGHWYDGAGARLPEVFATREGMIALPRLQVGRSLIEMHHYSVRSAASFVVKADRGLANRQTKQIDLSYWVERNFNTVENTAMARWGDALQAEMARLRDLPGVAAAHDRACAWHRARFETLVQSHAGYRLFCDCLHAADSAVFSEQSARQLFAMFARIGT